MKTVTATFPTLLMATALSVLSSGCGKQSAPPPAAPASTAPAAAQATPSNAEGLSLLDFTITKNQAGKSVLKGNVSNSTTRKLDHATVEFKLFDKAGNEVGTAMASVDNLGARFSWSFEVEIQPQDAASAKLVGFTAK
ncbi:MAG: hypothetical protein IPJ48_21535 [Propionivibrio sp.]|uniref:Lipoprotein n=1 Tax=Candidatus Propionivibrio dominans TaxID=2954373 RepID=A0A9D7FH25_9RHOO|nr:hypothetical protein [Candidatus Propionivibrio dominans]